MAGVDLLLRSADVKPENITAILATRGPGSFTGIRVALATAQGLARAIGCPATGVPSLAVLAARTSAARRVAVQAARRGYVYVQSFEDHDGRPLAVDLARVEPVDALAGIAGPVAAAEGLELPPGLARAPMSRCAAEALLSFAGSEPETPESLVPLYIEPPQTSPPAPTRTA
jgi:tRNA threonylcarbamoyladenosine biosynthesis protein TsaB